MKKVKIAYLGGGSRGWAWYLMSDLAMEKSFTPEVYLYDIDKEAAKANEIIGNRIPEDCPDANPVTYKAAETIEEALTDADFVVISILPGTFTEMGSDVHAPEKYGIYQSVGDTTGPGGIIRALRTLPMMEYFALKIKECCPKAWVINYTNPMTLSIGMLYRAFPEIKAFGCCHEVFFTRDLLGEAAKEILGIEEEITRDDIRVNVMGINHFTWLDKANYKGIDLFPVYRKFCEKYAKTGTFKEEKYDYLKAFSNGNCIKMDLFLRYGTIAAAGDRHLAEFCPGNWYLKDLETVAEWKFALTPIQYRIDGLKDRLAKSKRLVNREEKFELVPSGEEGVLQMRALLGLGDLVTNVNLPNVGQIPNLPLGAVVETNAAFTCDSVLPVVAGNMPDGPLGLTMPHVTNQQLVLDAVQNRDLELAFKAFAKDPLVQIGIKDARELFRIMIENTKEYLEEYK